MNANYALFTFQLIAFIILVLILLLKPTGIMGKGLNEKV